MTREKLKKYAGIGILIVGLVAIFFYVKARSPRTCTLEFVFPQGGVSASKIMLDYRFIEKGGKEEPCRIVQKFPKGAVARIIDEPSLPEGDYMVRLTLWMGGEERSFKKKYRHGTGDLTRFEINP